MDTSSVDALMGKLVISLLGVMTFALGIAVTYCAVRLLMAIWWNK